MANLQGPGQKGQRNQQIGTVQPQGNRNGSRLSLPQVLPNKHRQEGQWERFLSSFSQTIHF